MSADLERLYFWGHAAWRLPPNITTGGAGLSALTGRP